MSTRAIATLVLKVAALYCIIQSIPMFGAAVSSWFNLRLDPLGPQATAYWGATLGGLVSCTMLIALAYLCFFRGEQLVPMLIEPEGSTKEGRISSWDIQAIIFSGVGLLILALSVPGLGGSVTTVIYARILAQNHFFNTWEIALLVQSLIQCGIGLALFLRARGLALFWHRLRTLGLPPAK